MFAHGGKVQQYLSMEKCPSRGAINENTTKTKEKEIGSE